MGAPLAWFAVFGIAIIPGFMFMFNLISLLTHRLKKHEDGEYEAPEVTVLIPAYNAQSSIKETLYSVLNQHFGSPVKIIVADDGSTDQTGEIVRKVFHKHNNIKLLSLPHRGKSYALNDGLAHIDTEYFITVDSDTVLHENAINNIIKKISKEKYAAVAGLLLPNNRTNSFICRLQTWDYSSGIFAVKIVQSFYHSTLVAQGAFSAYKTSIIKNSGGWKDCVGEDIVLTFNMLKHGYKTGFEYTALAFTEVPYNLKSLLKQRKRWARGMIEGFKKNKGLFYSENLNVRSRILMTFNLFFPIVDLAISIFYPLGILLCLFGNFELIGPLTLLIIPLSLLLLFIIDIKLKKACRQIKYKLPHRNFLAFIGYMLFYQLILSPICFFGYLQEAVYQEKTW